MTVATDSAVETYDVSLTVVLDVSTGGGPPEKGIWIVDDIDVFL